MGSVDQTRSEAQMDTEPVVVLVTAGDRAEAERVATALLEARLAACVNLLPAITSLFWWEGKIDRAEEVLLLVKSQRALVPRLVETVRSTHSYEVFETVALPIVAGSPAYLDWLSAETLVPEERG
jgi:periplasmic divalent cation tolerance protein